MRPVIKFGVAVMAASTISFSAGYYALVVANSYPHLMVTEETGNGSKVSALLPSLVGDLEKQSNYVNSVLTENILKSRETNPEVFGWLLWDEFAVNYPVLYFPENNTKYLRTSISGEEDSNGCLYIDYRCKPDDFPLTVVHGHNMLNGKMFAKLPHLLNYKSLDDLSLIEYCTDAGARKYKVISVMSLNSNETSIDIDSAMTLSELEEMKQEWVLSSLVPISEVPSGIELMALNTCWYGESGNEHYLHCIVIAVRA